MTKEYSLQQLFEILYRSKWLCIMKSKTKLGTGGHFLLELSYLFLDWNVLFIKWGVFGWLLSHREDIFIFTIYLFTHTHTY